MRERAIVGHRKPEFSEGLVFGGDVVEALRSQEEGLPRSASPREAGQGKRRCGAAAGDLGSWRRGWLATDTWCTCAFRAGRTWPPSPG